MAALVLDAALSDIDEVPPADEFPPGTVGAIAKYIMQTSRFPNAGIALGTALVVGGTLCHRKIAGPTNSTTVLYIVWVGPSGIGKQRGLESIKQLVMAAGLGELIGPGWFASQQSLQDLMTREPFNKVSAFDEFGLTLTQMMKDPNASASIMIPANSLWGSLWGRYDGIERVDKPALFAIGPMWSFAGASTPAELYGVLTTGLIGNGFINRLLLMPVSEKPAERDEELPPDTIPQNLVWALHRMTGFGGKGVPNSTEGQAILKPVIRLGWGPGAEAIYRMLSAEMLQGRSEQLLALQQRVAEYAVRIATVIAVGRDSRTVDVVDIEWGRKIALRSRDTIKDGLEKHAGDLNFRQLCDAIEKALVEAPDNWLSARHLKRAFGRRSVWKRLYDDATNQLLEEGTMEWASKAPVTGGPMSAGFKLA